MTSKTTHNVPSMRGSVKNSLENLASGFLWQEDLSPGIPYILFVLGRVQLVSILLWFQIHLTTNQEHSDTLSRFLTALVGYLSGLDFLYKQPEQWIKLTIISIIGLYILAVVVIVIVFVLSYRKGVVLSQLERFYCFLGGAHNEILYWYINIILLRLLVTSGINYNFIGISLSSDSISSIVILTLLMGVNFGFCFISVVFRFDPFKTNNLVSSWTQSCQIVCGIFKTTQAFIIIVLPKNTSAVILFWIISLVLVTYQKYALHSQFPFYHRVGMMTALVLNSTGLALTYPNAFISVFQGINLIPESTLIYAQLIIFVITLKIGLDVYTRQLLDSLTNLTHGVKTQGDVFKTMQALSVLFEKTKLSINSQVDFDTIHEFYLFSVLKTHQKTCNEKICACRLILFNDSKSMQSNLNEMKSQLNEIYNDILFEFFKRSAHLLKSHRIHIYLSYLEMSKTLTGRKSLVTLFNIQREEASFILKVGLDKLNLKLKDKLNKFYHYNEGQILNLSHFFTYEQISSKLLDLIESASIDYMTFWSMFAELKIKSSDIKGLSQVFEDKCSQMENVWDTLSVEFPMHSRVFGLEYGKFFATYRNNMGKAEKLIKNYNDWIVKTKQLFKDKEINKKNLMDQRNISVYISMKKENLGRIVDLSSNISLLGYKKSELVGKNVNVLMPTCIQTGHQEALQNHIIINQKDDKLFRNLEVFSKRKNGYIVPMQVYKAISPQFDKELIYLGIMREVKGPSDFIILNSKGEVNSFTEGIMNRFEIQNRSKGVRLSDLFLSTEEIDEFVRNSPDNREAVQGYVEKDPLNNQSVYNLSETFELVQKRQFSTMPADQISVKCSKVSTLGTSYYVLGINYDRKMQKGLTVGTVNLKKLMESGVIDNDEGKVADSIRDSNVENQEEGNESDIAEGTHAKLPVHLRYHDDATPNSPQQILTTEAYSNLLPVRNEKFQDRAASNSFREPATDSDNYVDTEGEEDNPAKLKSLGLNSIDSRTSVSKIKVKNSRIEEALFQGPSMKMMKLLEYISIYYGLQTLIFLIFYGVEVSSETVFMKQDIKFINELDEIAEQVNNLFLLTRLGILTENNYFAPNKYSPIFSNEDYLKTFFHKSLGHFNDLLATENLLDSISVSDDFKLMKIKKLDDLSDKTVTFTEFYRMLRAAGLRIDHSPDFMSTRDIDKRLIGQNTFNSLMLSKKLINELARLSYQETSNSEGNLIGFLVVTVLSGLGIILLYFYLEFRFLLNQRKLFDAFARVNQSHIEEIMNDCTSTGNNSKMIIIKNKTDLERLKLGKNKRSFKTKVIEFDENKKNIWKILLIIIYICLYILSFAILEVRKDTIGSSGSIRARISNIQLIINLDLTFQSMSPLLFQLILKEDFTTKSMAEVESIFKAQHDELLGYENSLNMLMTELTASEDIGQLLTGNLCEVLNLTDVCNMNEKYIKNGVYGLNNALVNLLMDIKKTRDGLDDSLASKMKVLTSDSFSEYEKSMLNVFDDVYQRLIELNFDLLISGIDSKIYEKKVFSIAFGFVVVAVLILSRIFIILPMEISRIRNRKILRMIPVKVVMANNFIKAYLRRNTTEAYRYLFK